jgi:hypothetical protein
MRTAKRTERDAASTPSSDALVARLESEIDFLRTELAARTEEMRRRDHIIAALAEQRSALSETVDAQMRPQDANTAPQRDETGRVGSPLTEPVWRRWWRKMTGSDTRS